MRTIKLLERFEWTQLNKGRLIDVADGLAVGVSPDALDRQTERNEKRGSYKRKTKTREGYRDKRSDKKKEYFAAHFVERGLSSRCRHCNMVFEGKHHRLAAMTHLRRAHKEIWRKR